MSHDGFQNFISYFGGAITLKEMSGSETFLDAL